MPPALLFRPTSKSEWFVFLGRVGKPEDAKKRPYDPTRPISTLKTSWRNLRGPPCIHIGKKLDRYHPPEFLVPGLPHSTHPALTEFFEDTIMPDSDSLNLLFTGRQRSPTSVIPAFDDSAQFEVNDFMW